MENKVVERTFEIWARQEMPQGCEERELIFSETRSVTNLLKTGMHNSPPAGCRFLLDHKAERQELGLKNTRSPGRLRARLFPGLWRVGGAGGVLAGALGPEAPGCGGRFCVWRGRHLELRVAAGLLPAEPSGAGVGGRVAPEALV